MSVLTIAQNVAMETGFTSPSSLVGSADENSIQLLALIKKETRALSDRYEWNKLIVRGTFNFVNAQEAYDLPTDFKDYMPKTIWNYTARRPLIAPITAEDYEIQKNYLITSGIDKMVRVYDGQMHITPVPSSTDTINYEYTTLNIYQSAGGVGKPAITLDTDTTTIDEYLVELGVKLRFLVAKGLVTPAELEKSFEKKDYDMQLDHAILTDGFGSKNPINMSSRVNAFWMGAYTQDSDFPAV